MITEASLESFRDVRGKAKSRYRNAQEHLATAETKYRRQLRRVESLRKQLENEESLLQRRVEKYQQAREILEQNRTVYRLLTHQQKSSSSAESTAP